MSLIFAIRPYLKSKSDFLYIIIYESRNRTSLKPRLKKSISFSTQLVSEITRNGELVRFETKLQQRKQYDLCEKDYIENQRLRKELGN